MSDQNESPRSPSRSKNVNLFFGTRGELKEVAKKDDASTAYIIFQNDRLHAHMNRMERRAKEAERHLARASDDTERAERTLTCLRGMLHNEIEKGRMLTEINSVMRRHRDAMSRTLETMGFAAATHAALTFGAHSLAWAANPDTSSLDSLTFAFHLGSAAVFGWVWYRSRADAGAGCRSAGRVLSELNDQLAEATRGTEHLHEIVDEL
eukprot:jgi/Tetstr1/464202/TSEL_009007.t1